jgi:putative transposase
MGLYPPFSNQIKYQQFPWLREIHRDAHSQPFPDLQQAWQNYWNALGQIRQSPAEHQISQQ